MALTEYRKFSLIKGIYKEQRNLFAEIVKDSLPGEEWQKHPDFKTLKILEELIESLEREFDFEIWPEDIES
jgi:hypothetical protein